MKQSYKDKLEASLFAYPWVLFALPAVIGYLRAGDDPWLRFAIAGIIGFLLVYLASWWILPVAPVVIENRRRYLAVFGLALALQMFVWFASWNYGGAGYFTVYMLSMACHLTPYGQHWKVMLGVALIGLVQVLVPLVLVEGLPYFLMGMSVTMAMLLMIRWGMESDRRKQLFLRAEAEATRTGERERISADLHDLLGQTLTAISIHAEVASRELQRDRAAAATAAVERIGQLAKAGINDVRAVVTQLRSLDLDEQITQFTHLSGGRSVAVSVSDYSQLAADDEFSQLCAWITVEAGANIWHHSSAKQVWIGVGQDTYVMVDNGRYGGARSEPGSAPKRAGNGLANLVQRGQNIAQVSWGWLDQGPARERVNAALAAANWPRGSVPPAPKEGFYVLAKRI